MAQRINVALNSIPYGSRDLIEFIFFCGVGFTAGSLGLIWASHFLLFQINMILIKVLIEWPTNSANKPIIHKDFLTTLNLFDK